MHADLLSRAAMTMTLSPPEPEAISPPLLVAGRSCGTCSMCCKVFNVSWLDRPKPAGKWCHHCKPGKGCAIWQDIPQRCADYYCLWRLKDQLDDRWRPDVSGFVISLESGSLPYSVMVDPGRPDSWRKEPYYSGLQRAALSAIEAQKVFVVIVGARHWVLLPDGDVPVPAGLENTDFRVTRAVDGRWGVTFLAQKTP
jgi:hypothetical protein